MRKPEVGDKMKTWFSGQPDGCSMVLKVEKYRGLYSQWFQWVVTLTAPRTSKREIEMAI